MSPLQSSRHWFIWYLRIRYYIAQFPLPRPSRLAKRHRRLLPQSNPYWRNLAGCPQIQEADPVALNWQISMSNKRRSLRQQIYICQVGSFRTFNAGKLLLILLLKRERQCRFYWTVASENFILPVAQFAIPSRVDLLIAITVFDCQNRYYYRPRIRPLIVSAIQCGPVYLLSHFAPSPFGPALPRPDNLQRRAWNHRGTGNSPAADHAASQSQHKSVVGVRSVDQLVQWTLLVLSLSKRQREKVGVEVGRAFFAHSGVSNLKPHESWQQTRTLLVSHLTNASYKCNTAISYRCQSATGQNKNAR